MENAWFIYKPNCIYNKIMQIYLYIWQRSSHWYIAPFLLTEQCHEFIFCPTIVHLIPLKFDWLRLIFIGKFVSIITCTLRLGAHTVPPAKVLCVCRTAPSLAAILRHCEVRKHPSTHKDSGRRSSLLLGSRSSASNVNLTLRRRLPCRCDASRVNAIPC
jgi:hypothetical protein